MGTNYKATKTELIAIYRLEFYKNKKNWKLCQDIKKEPPQSEPLTIKSKNMNETYNVETDVVPEHVSAHNKAFLHEQPADEVIQPPDPEPPVDARELCQHTWVEQPWIEDKSEPLWQEAQPEWCGAEAEGVPEDVAYTDECDGLYHEHIWAPVDQYSQFTPQYEPLEQDLELFSPTDLLQTAEEWLRNNGYSCQEEYEAYYEQLAMLDDSADFVRGAHRAPHSSEIDLSANHECSCVSPGALCVLSARQLARCTRRHARALRDLLLEHALRDKLFSPTSLSPLSFDDYPTRDTDPLHTPDCLLAGSHLPSVGDMGRGRGRGRLRQGERIIGIGMGRPFRL